LKSPAADVVGAQQAAERTAEAFVVIDDGNLDM